MQWLKITIKVDPENREALLSLMLDLGAGGVVESDPGSLLPMVDQLPQECHPEILPTAQDYLTGYWLANEQGEDVLARLRIVVGPEAVTARILSDEEWLNTDTIGFPELRIGRRWIIYPERLAEAPPPGLLPIYLRPGQAFGTGLHPTTQLCLELLEEVPVQGKAFDAGTGSGILTIALSLLGFTDLVACDIDATAVEVTKANLASNGVTARVRHADPSLLGETGFSLIVANILADVISELAPTFRSLANPGAFLITSGIVAAKAPQVIAHLVENGYEIVKRKDKENWVSFLARLKEREL